MNFLPLIVAILCFIDAKSVSAFRADAPAGLVRNTASTSQSTVPIRMVSAAQMSLGNEAQKLGVSVTWHHPAGTPVSVRGKDLGKWRSFSGGKGLVPGARTAYGPNAVAVLDNLSGLYRIRDAALEFSVKSVDPDRFRFHHVKIEQLYEGLRVVGGELLVHFDGDDQVYEVNGTYVPDVNVSVDPKIQGSEAVRLAQRDLTGLNATRLMLQPGIELVVFALDQDPVLAYEMMFLSDDVQAKGGRWRCWVDANSGKIIRCYNDIRKIAAPTDDGSNATVTGYRLQGEGGTLASFTGWFENTGYYYLYSKLRYWYVFNQMTSGYSDNSTYAYRGTQNWGVSDRAEISAAMNFEMVQTYFMNVHGLNSFNNANGYVRANVHMRGADLVNAYWDGIDFHFGDGDGITASELAVLDVCGHEYTHAVTENTANLDYYSESGALNESFSDIFGAAIEFYSQPDGRSLYPNRQAGQADWLLGEDCWISSKALRDMRNPNNVQTVGTDGQQPSRYKGAHWFFGTDDNGGVHYNSGVQNFFFFLLSEGGTGNNDGTNYVVNGIGLTHAEKIAYRALTVYCSQYTDYPGARAAWLSAAQDLNPDWVSSVQAAWDGCGVGADLATTDDAWDPADNTGRGATLLDNPSTVEQSSGPHTLSSSDHYDWFKVYLNQDVTYHFNTSGGSGDDYGELYSDSNGDQLLVSDDDSGGSHQFSLTLTPSSSAWYYLRVRAFNVGTACEYTLRYWASSGGTIDELGNAVDATNLTWVSGGGVNWSRGLLVTHDGNDAAQSGRIGHSQQSWIETTIHGAGRLSFWWKVSSERYYDDFNLYVDGVIQQKISGEVDWENQIVVLSAGVHTIRWSYEKDYSVADGSDAGWVDQVLWATNHLMPMNDYDGEGVSDLAVYYSAGATWYIRTLSGVPSWATNWGIGGCVPVPGDYDGDRIFDLAGFQLASGNWFIRRLGGGSLANGANWGFSGAVPVAGDYDGDEVADLAIYDPTCGNWYIRTVSGTILAWALNWGYNGAIPVGGDFNGDGESDLAVYDRARGNWYIRTLSGTVLAYAVNWGFKGAVPLAGDYDGNGVDDLAVYNQAAGNWYIRAFDQVIAHGANWGWSAASPVKP